MIFTGVKLAIVGMAIVVLFLLLLILIVNISYKLLAASSLKELAEIEAADLRKRKRAVPVDEENVLIAIISAAVAAHRSKAP